MMCLRWLPPRPTTFDHLPVRDHPATPTEPRPARAEATPRTCRSASGRDSEPTHDVPARGVRRRDARARPTYRLAAEPGRGQPERRPFPGSAVGGLLRG